MSEVRKLSDIPTIVTGKGTSLLCLDSGGNLRKLNHAGLIDLLRATGGVFVRIALSPQNLDADQLTEGMVMYQSNSDMNLNSWRGFEWKNFPTSRPEGCFNLLTVRTGNDMTQIYTSYASEAVYLRTTVYSPALEKRRWKDWVMFSGEIVGGGGKALSYNLLRKSAERRAA